MLVEEEGCGGGASGGASAGWVGGCSGILIEHPPLAFLAFLNTLVDLSYTCVNK